MARRLMGRARKADHAVPALRMCPLCGQRVDSLINHLRAPEDEGCPETPMPGFHDPDLTDRS